VYVQITGYEKIMPKTTHFPNVGSYRLEVRVRCLMFIIPNCGRYHTARHFRISESTLITKESREALDPYVALSSEALCDPLSLPTSFEYNERALVYGPDPNSPTCSIYDMHDVV
jgi:hypothetical protein